MSKRFRLLLVVSVTVPLLAYVGVSAESSTTASTTNEQTPTTSTTSTTSTSSQTSTLDQRLAARTATLETKLSVVQQRHLETVCKAAQGKAAAANTIAGTLGTNRDQLYNNIVSKLTTLATKLKAQGIDTTQLNAEITTLQGDITTFNSAAATY